jgi:hypothetical protein
MLATSQLKKASPRPIDPDPNLATFLPSPLLLQLVIENGWQVIRTELAPSQDQNGFVYLVTLKSASRLQSHQLVLPRTALIEKILAEHLSVGISAN